MRQSHVFSAQGGALKNPKAVLFINHRERQTFKRNALLNNGVCANENMHHTFVEPAECLCSRDVRGAMRVYFGREFFTLRRGKKRDGKTALREEFTKTFKVLTSENFCWRHIYRLHVIAGDNIACACSHRSFTGADISFKKTVHGRITFKITDDISYCALLRSGERERQETLKFLCVFCGARESKGGILFDLLFLCQTRKLEGKHFFKRKAFFCGFRVRKIFGAMNKTQRRCAIRQMIGI